MISCDFAPNEQLDDALLSLKLIAQPWRWFYGTELKKVEALILKILFHVNNLNDDRHKNVKLFLTGRSALYYLLNSLKLPKNSEVIIQAFTCEAVVLPIIANHLRPVYADIENQTFSLNPIDLEKKITEKTKVIILQHSFGIPPKHRERIQTVAKQHHLLLIEDIAHGFGNITMKQFNNETIYLMSFGRSKAISSVFGGAIVTNSNEIMKQLNNITMQLPQLSSSFIFRILLYKPLSLLIKSTYDLYLGKIIHKLINFLKILPPEITQKEKKGEYHHFFDKAYPNALAILLLHQLKKFDRINIQRAKVCEIYSQKILNLKSKILNLSLGRYPMLIKDRDKILHKARQQNIFLGQWYSQPVAPRGLNLKNVGYQIGSCPVAEKVCQQIINLPTNIKISEANKIVRTLNNLTLMI